MYVLEKRMASVFEGISLKNKEGEVADEEKVATNWQKWNTGTQRRRKGKGKKGNQLF